MAVPESNREVYRQNPLAEVVADLRFSPILRIESEPPAQFQEAIRDRYPQYRRVAAASQLPKDVPAPVRSLIEGVGAAAGPVYHYFGTQDQDERTRIPVTYVTLSRESLQFTTRAYRRWEEFRAGFDHVRAAFEQVYRPGSYTRIRLRYVDVIRRSRLGLENVSWAELLNPSIGGELAAPEFGENIDSASRQLHCKLEGEDSFLTLKTGIAPTQPNNAVASKERCFLIDGDFHTHKRMELQNVTAALDSFHRASGNLFRWAIRPRLRDALGPEPLD
jgi:uncharacterized protein (TIGR04255 family)